MNNSSAFSGRPRVLVVCYSWTGHTLKLARAIAQALAPASADLEVLHDVRPRNGWRDYLRSALEALRHRPADIVEPTHRSGPYDLVVVGTPVWAGNVASPVRNYLQQRHGRLPRLALFCTCGGSSQEKVLNDMATLAGTAPQATLALTEAQLNGPDMAPAVARFAEQLASPVSTRAAAAEPA